MADSKISALPAASTPIAGTEVTVLVQGGADVKLALTPANIKALAVASNLADVASASASRTSLGLGTAAVQNTSTSGANVPLMNGNNTWSGSQTISNLIQGVGNVIAVAGAATVNAASGSVRSEALVGAVSYALTLTNSTILVTSTIFAIATNSASLPVTVNIIDQSPGAGSVVITVGMAALTGTVTIRFIVLN